MTSAMYESIKSQIKLYKGFTVLTIFEVSTMSDLLKKNYHSMSVTANAALWVNF